MDENIGNVPKLRFPGFTDAWEQRKLGELAQFSKGQGYSKGDLVEDGMPIILYGRLYTKYETVISMVDTYVIERENSMKSKGGEVIVPSSGETAEDIARASVVAKAGIILGGDLNVIIPVPEIDPAFLAITISNGLQQKELSRRAQGKSVVHIQNSDLREVLLIYPQFDEQKRISTLFQNFDHLITLHQRKLRHLQDQKTGLLQKMFPKDGTDVPELRFPDFTDAWEQRKLGEVCDEFRSGEFISASNISLSGAYPVYGGNGLRGYTDTYNHNGEYALIGRQGALCGNMQYAVGKAYFTEHAVAVRADKKNVTNFLYHLFGTMNLGQYSGQSAQPGLAVGNLINLKALIPTKAEQTQISTFLSSLDNLITLHQRKLKHLQEQKKGLLQQMFI